MKKLRRRPSAVAMRIAGKMREKGFAQADLVRRSGLSRVYISELLRGTKQSVKHAKLVALANSLEVSVIYLTEGARPSPFSHGPFRRRPTGVGSETPDPGDLERDKEEEEEAYRHKPFPSIFQFTPCASFRPTGAVEKLIPLYFSRTETGTRIVPTSAGVLARPPLLASSDGAYAVVADERMSPRYQPNELLYVAPDSRPDPGDYVFVIVRSEIDGQLEGRVWRLVYLAYGYAELESFNPPKLEQINLDRIVHIHRIVLAGEAKLDR
jgi:transcriptional regulator with XRE-family HTH domain